MGRHRRRCRARGGGSERRRHRSHRRRHDLHRRRRHQGVRHAEDGRGLARPLRQHACAAAPHGRCEQAGRRGDSRQRARWGARDGAGLSLPHRHSGCEGRPARSAARHHSGRGRHAAAAAAVRRATGARDVHRRQACTGVEGQSGRHPRRSPAGARPFDRLRVVPSVVEGRGRQPSGTADRGRRVRQVEGAGAQDAEDARHCAVPGADQERNRSLSGDAPDAREDRQRRARAAGRRGRD